ncbi:TIGR03086 family metal-binding protein [Plantactinospora sp. WMMC1484]|uniref:TIGR03086 family metal-binding protein n=1 Tax=Plantactinospora sp. WMMC1484 TaxID=3404122 RepID=UPI003BF5B49E
MLDLGPAAQEVIRLLDGVTDDQLSHPTPSTDTSVAALLDHLMGLSLAFTWAARKSDGDGSGPPEASADNLDPAWRSLLPRRLTELVEAWRAPDAWTGMASAGGATLPAESMGVVALDELVLHGWDLAKATGQPFHCDPASTEAVLAFTAESARPEQAAGREGLFGPVVPVPADAPPFDRALGFSGRDPHWTPPA